MNSKMAGFNIYVANTETVNSKMAGSNIYVANTETVKVRCLVIKFMWRILKL